MEKYIKISDALKVCRKWNKFCFELNDAKGQRCAETIEDEILELSGADVVKVETVRAWLYEMAFNSVGCVVNGDFSDACEDIISRLDGLRNFARDRSDGDER